MIATVIPARLGSTRLPRKLVLSETGKPLLFHTIDRVLESKLTNIVFVVTEDQEIFDLVRGYGNSKVQAVRTGPAKSGTERIAKFVSTYFVDDSHIIINFQGDEPELPGRHIDQLVNTMQARLCDVATLASPLTDKNHIHDLNVVKVVTNHNGQAAWFSRHSIPIGGPWLKHVGIYAYTAKFLRQLFLMTPTTACGESLEQLQWLQAGYKIQVLVDDVESVGIDSLDDYYHFVDRQKRK